LRSATITYSVAADLHAYFQKTEFISLIFAWTPSNQFAQEWYLQDLSFFARAIFAAIEFIVRLLPKIVTFNWWYDDIIQVLVWDDLFILAFIDGYYRNIIAVLSSFESSTC
jgi:hypothetical protein